jgi:hypothetical protein
MPTASQRRGFPVLALVFSLGLAIAGSAVLGAEPGGKPPTGGRAAAKPAAAKAAAEEPADEPAEEPAAKPAVPRHYEKLAVDGEQRKKKSAISAVLRAGKFEGGEQAAFDAYYTAYFFPLWSDPANFESITPENRAGKDEAKLRSDLRRELGVDFKTAKTGQVHQHLTALALDNLSKVAKGNYHPVSRFNAVLMIGDLNQAEPARTSDSPVPLAAALPVLLDAFKDPKQIDVVKIAALRGLIRHSSLGIADQQARDTSLLPAVLTLVTTRVSPDRTADGQIWMRVLGIEVLANVRTVGPKGEVTKALTEVAAEPEGPLVVRCEAAKALGMLNYPADPPLDPLPVAATLNELFVLACTNVTSAYEESASPIRRRELKEQVYCLRIALEGPGDNRRGIQGWATTDAQKAAVTKVLQPIQKTMELLDTKDLEDEVLAKRLTETVEKVRPVGMPARPRAAAAKPAAGAKPATAPAKPATAPAKPATAPAKPGGAAKPTGAAPAKAGGAKPAAKQ